METGVDEIYPVTYTYNENDQVTSEGLPVVADLAAGRPSNTHTTASGYHERCPRGHGPYTSDTTYTRAG